MFWTFLIVLVCVGIPVVSIFGFLGWKAMLKARPVDPIEVLALRFASGDIDEEEYSRKLWLLTASPQPAVTVSPQPAVTERGA